jgi:hypothetical protein
MNKAKENTVSQDSRVAKISSSVISNIKSSRAKKISATVGFIAVLVGLIAGAIGLVKQYLAARELNREIAMYIEVGDRFVEQYKLNEGIEKYEKGQWIKSHPVSIYGNAVQHCLSLSN